jgi:hypothetical protein
VNAAIGTRVRVTHVEGHPARSPEKWDQPAAIDRYEPLVDETGAVWDSQHPVLRLDDGREWIGLECWWTPETGAL